MSDDIHRCYVRWEGLSHKGVIKLGKFRWDMDRLPLVLRALQFFDLWFEPGVQEEIRMRPCDPKEEVTATQHNVLAAYVKAVGDSVRPVQDVVEG